MKWLLGRPAPTNVHETKLQQDVIAPAQAEVKKARVHLDRINLILQEAKRAEDLARKRRQ